MQYICKIYLNMLLFILVALLLLWLDLDVVQTVSAKDKEEEVNVAVPYFTDSAQPVKALVDDFVAHNPKYIFNSGMCATASIGRFCDRDEPFEALIQNMRPDEDEELLLARKFPSSNPQPKCIYLGERKLIAIVNPDNPVKNLSFTQIQEMLKKGGFIRSWDQLGGRPKTIKIYDQGIKSWSRYILKSRCMIYEKGNDGGISRGWYEFREDIMKLADYDAAVLQVEKDPDAICFVAYQDQPLKGVSVLSIAAPQSGIVHLLKMKPIILAGYPLSEPLFLWLHPKATKQTENFAKFCLSHDAAKFLGKYGFVTPWEKMEQEGQQRLVEVKSGKGPKASIFGLPMYSQFEKDLNIDYVKSRALLQTDYKPGSGQQAIAAFVNNPASDILFLDGSASNAAIKPVKDKWDDMISKGMQKHTLASTSVAIVVNSVNKLDSITLDQVRDIFTGKISDWNIVGKDLVPAGTGDVSSPVFVKPDKPSENARRGMVLYGLITPIPGTPGNVPDPYCAVLSRAIGQSKLENYQAKKDSAEVLSAVSIDPAGIAFVDASQLIIAAGKGIKVLAIGEAGKAILPQYQAILDGSYPLSEPITLYFMPKPDPAGTTQPAATQPATSPADLAYKIINMPTSQPAMTPEQTKADFVAFIVSGEPVDTFRKHGLVCQGMEIIPPPPATKPAVEPTKNHKDKPGKPAKADTQPSKPDLPVWK